MADRRRRGRSGLSVLVALVLLAGLLWGLDSLARRGAEALLARDLADVVGVEQQPRVVVHGPVFLPQVLRGRYDRVDVALSGITSGPLRVDRLDATLSDVRLPFHDVLVQDARAVGVGRSVERVTLRYDDLNRYLDATGRPLEVGPGPDGKVRLVGDVDVLGRRIAVTTDADLSTSDGRLTLVPTSLGTSTDQTPAVRLLLAQRLRLTVSLDTLPFGQRLTEVAVGPEALTVSAGGTGIVVRP